MPRRFRRAAASVAIACAAFLGCNRSVVQQQKQPPDPLLVSKKPVEGRPYSPPPAATPPKTATIGQPQAAAVPVNNSTVTVPEGGPWRLSSEVVVRP
jgi:hypothetical protein